VRAWAVKNKTDVTELEVCVHNAYRSTILAGKILVDRPPAPLPRHQEVKILEDAEVKRRQNPRLRYPRQLRHIDHTSSCKLAMMSLLALVRWRRTRPMMPLSAAETVWPTYTGKPSRSHRA
jgi:hypothetical protein